MKQFRTTTSRSTFQYRPRPPEVVLARGGIEMPERYRAGRWQLAGGSWSFHREVDKPLMGTDTLLGYVAHLEAAREHVERIETRIREFLDQRPHLAAAYAAFMARGGGDRKALRAFMIGAAAKAAGTIIQRGHLRLVVSNDGPRRRPVA